MSLAHDIHAAQGGLTAVLWQAHLAGQEAHQARRVASVEAQSDANAVAAVDRLAAALRASCRRETALQAELRETKAALARAQGVLIRLTA